MKYNILGRPIISSGDLDHRYTINIYLIRESRPRYWNFHCLKCGEKVCELQGNLAYAVDLSSDQAIQRVRCNSRECGGRMWYEFSMK